MFLNAKMFTKFQELLSKYTSKLSPDVSFNHFTVVQELSRKIDPHEGYMPKPGQLSPHEQLTMERIAAIMAAVVHIRDLNMQNNEEPGCRHFSSYDPHKQQLIDTHLSFIATVSRSFFDSQEVAARFGQTDSMTPYNSIKDFLTVVLESALKSFFEAVLFEELIEEHELAMTDVEWNGFKSFIRCVRGAVGATMVNADSFYVVGFNSRFGSLVSFRNEKQRRLRQANMMIEFDALRKDNEDKTVMIQQLKDQVSLMTDTFKVAIQNMASNLEVKLNTAIAAGNKSKKK